MMLQKVRFPFAAILFTLSFCISLFPGRVLADPFLPTDTKLREMLETLGTTRVESLNQLIEQTEDCAIDGYVWNPEEEADEIGSGYSRYGGSGNQYSGGSSRSRSSASSSPARSARSSRSSSTSSASSAPSRTSSSRRG